MQKSLYHSLDRRNAGVGMVEVLVALVVLSVGMLGTATLYVSTMQAKTTALSRMQAVNLATDIADRIRANRTAQSNYGLADTASVTTAPSTKCVQDASAPVACTPAQMAAYDLYLWSASVLSTLPGTVKRHITVDTATTPATYVIYVEWTEPSAGTLSHTMTVRI